VTKKTELLYYWIVQFFFVRSVSVCFCFLFPQRKVQDRLLAQTSILLHSRESLRQLFKASSDEWKQKYSPKDLDRKFLLKTIDIVKNHMEKEVFSAEEFAQEMNLSLAHLQKRLSRPVETTSLRLLYFEFV